MNIYDAIMKAADTIENNPRLYDFMECTVKYNCNTPHCMVGWIGFHLGMHGKRIYRDVLPALGLEEWGTIGDQMGATFEKHRDYTQNPKSAAALLRDFAQRFKPQPKFVGIPDSIRAIFTHNPGEYVS